MATSRSLYEIRKELYDLRKELAELERKNVAVTRILYGESQQGERAKCRTKRKDREENIYLKEHIKEQEQLFEHLCAEAVARDNRAAEEAAKASDGDDDDY